MKSERNKNKAIAETGKISQDRDLARYLATQERRKLEKREYYLQLKQKKERGRKLMKLVLVLAVLFILSRMAREGETKFSVSDTWANAVGVGQVMPEATAWEGECQDVVLAGFAPRVQEWSEEIGCVAQEYELDPVDLATVVQIESCGDSDAISPGEAVGLTQIVRKWHMERLPKGVGPEGFFDPTINLRAGAGFLAELMVRFPGNKDAVFAAYNGGDNAGRWIAGEITREEYIAFLQTSLGWSYETAQSKADQVMIYVYWAEMRDPQFLDARLAEWLAAGGASLCNQP